MTFPNLARLYFAAVFFTISSFGFCAGAAQEAPSDGRGVVPSSKELIQAESLPEEPIEWKRNLRYQVLSQTLTALAEPVDVEVLNARTLADPYEDVEVTLRLIKVFQGDEEDGALVTYKDSSAMGESYFLGFDEEPLIMSLCQAEDGSYSRTTFLLHYPWIDVKEEILATKAKYPNRRVITSCR